MQAHAASCSPMWPMRDFCIWPQVREWFSIDRLRLDKFLMLVRKFIAQMLTYLHSVQW